MRYLRCFQILWDATDQNKVSDVLIPIGHILPGVIDSFKQMFYVSTFLRFHHPPSIWSQFHRSEVLIQMSASIDLLYLSKYCCCCLTVFVREEMWLTISAQTYFPLGLSYSISLRNFSMCLSGKMLKCIWEAIFPNFMLQQTAHLYTSRPLRQSFEILIWQCSVWNQPWQSYTKTKKLKEINLNWSFWWSRFWYLGHSGQKNTIT